MCLSCTRVPWWGLMLVLPFTAVHGSAYYSSALTLTYCLTGRIFCFYLVLLVLMNHDLASIYALFSECGNVVLLPNNPFFYFHLHLNGVLWLKIQRKMCKLTVNRGCIMLLASFGHVPGCVFFFYKSKAQWCIQEPLPSFFENKKTKTKNYQENHHQAAKQL